MTANFITIIRLLLSFWVIGSLGRHRTLEGVLCLVIVGIFALDALDGYLARKRNTTSKTGELLDTLADRMIENTFWIYFFATGPLPVWMPIAVMSRGFLTDALQRMHGYPTKGWTHVLARSRVTRVDLIPQIFDFITCYTAKTPAVRACAFIGFNFSLMPYTTIMILP